MGRLDRQTRQAGSTVIGRLNRQTVIGTFDMQLVIGRLDRQTGQADATDKGMRCRRVQANLTQLVLVRIREALLRLVHLPLGLLLRLV